jgi:hypothetical protein
LCKSFARAAKKKYEKKQQNENTEAHVDSSADAESELPEEFVLLPADGTVVTFSEPSPQPLKTLRGAHFDAAKHS